MSYGRIRRGRMAIDDLKSNFTSLYNEFIRDVRLTGNAKAVFMLIASHEDGYGITVDTLCEDMREGPSAVKAALRCLEDHGYLVRRRERDARGRLGSTDYEITDMPDGINLSVAKPYPDDDGPAVENRPQDESDTGTRRSRPRGENPPVDDPPVDDRTGKKTNLKKTTHPPTGGEHTGADARTREAAPNDRDDAPGTQGTLDGQPAKPKRSKKAPWPGSFTPTAAQRAWAEKHYPTVDLDAQIKDFNAYWDAPENAGVVRDWSATWRMNVRQSSERGTHRRRHVGPTDLVEQATPTVEKWCGWWSRRGPVTHRARVELLNLAVTALEAGATIEQIQAALKQCNVLSPKPWHFQDALVGLPTPGGQDAAGVKSRRQAENDAMFARAHERGRRLDELEEQTGQEINYVELMMQAAGQGIGFEEANRRLFGEASGFETDTGGAFGELGGLDDGSALDTSTVRGELA